MRRVLYARALARTAFPAEVLSTVEPALAVIDKVDVPEEWLNALLIRKQSRRSPRIVPSGSVGADSGGTLV